MTSRALVFAARMTAVAALMAAPGCGFGEQPTPVPEVSSEPSERQDAVDVLLANGSPCNPDDHQCESDLCVDGVCCNADCEGSCVACLKALTGEEASWLEVPGGVVHKKYPVYKEVTDCALFINAPLAKCHNLVCTTLATKNLMGTLDRPERHLCTVQEVDKPFEAELWRLTDSGLSLHEERFCHKLADLVSVLRTLPRPRLNVIDGLIGRDGTAFNEGDNHPLGWTVIGVNEVHVDTVGSYLMGLDPTGLPYLRVASERGLGTNRLDEIEVVDLASGEILDAEALEAYRSPRVLMPICRHADGYYDRLRADGSVVPWRIDAVNKQREIDKLDPVPVA